MSVHIAVTILTLPTNKFGCHNIANIILAIGTVIGKYADKTSRKKITSAEKQQMIHIEQKIEHQMVVGIKNISKKLSSIPSINSPEIGTLQHCLYLHHKNDEIKHKLPEFGFLKLSYML